MNDPFDPRLIRAALMEGGRSKDYVDAHTHELGYHVGAFPEEEMWRAREVAHHASPICRACWFSSRRLPPEGQRVAYRLCLAQGRLMDDCWRPRP